MAKQKKKDRRILGTQLHREIIEAEVFARIDYVGPSGGQPGVYFEVYRGEYRAFIRWHSSPNGFTYSGYGEDDDNPSRISLLSVSKGSFLKVTEHLMWWEPEDWLPQVKKLKKKDTKNKELKQFLEDIVTYFR